MSKEKEDKRQLINVFIKEDIVNRIRERIRGREKSRSQFIEEVLEKYLKGDFDV